MRTKAFLWSAKCSRNRSKPRIIELSRLSETAFPFEFVHRSTAEDSGIANTDRRHHHLQEPKDRISRPPSGRAPLQVLRIQRFRPYPWRSPSACPALHI